MNRRPLLIALVAACMSTIAVNAATASPKDPAAFCQSHRDLDYPDAAFYGPKHQGRELPKEVAAADADHWRCMDGIVYVCNGGASGSACQKMYPSRKPHQAITEFCADNPGADFVAMAIIANSSSTWRCEGTQPEIIRTVELDKRGFMKSTWGAVSGFEASADPR